MELAASMTKVRAPERLLVANAKKSEGEEAAGWLTKKGSKRHNWKRRWFVLKGQNLTYFELSTKDESIRKQKGQLCVLGSELVVTGDKSKYAHQFELRLAKEPEQRAAVVRATEGSADAVAASQAPGGRGGKQSLLIKQASNWDNDYDRDDSSAAGSTDAGLGRSIHLRAETADELVGWIAILRKAAVSVASSGPAKSEKAAASIEEEGEEELTAIEFLMHSDGSDFAHRAHYTGPEHNKEVEKEGWQIMNESLMSLDHSTEELQKIFQQYDQDGSGSIDLDELDTALKHIGIKKSQKELKEMMKAADKDGNNEIDFQEFVAMMQRDKKQNTTIVSVNGVLHLHNLTTGAMQKMAE